MQVKVCPKCGAENALTYSACRSCQSSLTNVAVSESRPFARQPVAGAAQSSRPGPQQPMRPNPGPYVARPSGPPMPLPEEQPVRPGNSPASIITGLLVIVALCVGCFFLWQKQNAPKPQPSISADKVVMSFLQAKSSGDVSKVKQFISKDSIQRLDKGLGSQQAQSAGITRQDVQDMLLWGVQPTSSVLQSATYTASVVDEKNLEEGNAKVIAKVKTKSPLFGEAELEVPYVLVNEDNQWKVDLHQSSRESTGGIIPALTK